MLKITLARSLFLLTLVTPPGYSGTTQFFSAAFCQSLQDKDWGTLPFGCPLMWSGGGDVVINEVDLIFVDNSTRDAVSAYVVIINWDGTAYYGPTKYSCSTQWDGCGQNSDPKYVGLGQINFYNPILTGFTLYPLSVTLGVIGLPDGSAVEGYRFNIN